MITKSKIFNESEQIDQVVKKYNTNHTFREISDELSFENIKTIISKYDDIIYDPSLLPTYILSKNISEDYKVALSGDGGDELLSGYDHYSNFHNKNKYPETKQDLAKDDQNKDSALGSIGLKPKIVHQLNDKILHTCV